MSEPVFIVVSERPAPVEELAESTRRTLGFSPRIVSVTLSELSEQLDGEAFVFPCSLDFSILDRAQFAQAISEARRRDSAVVVHHDDVDISHPLIVECFADLIVRNLAGSDVPPRRVGLVLTASGHGDAGSRAQSYRLMRLVWEQLSLGAGEVGFLRHAQPFLRHTLDRCRREALQWVLLPQMQWAGEHFEYARVILEDVQPECEGWKLLQPPGNHPALVAWLAQRIVKLWQAKRSRVASPKYLLTASVPPFEAEARVSEVRDTAAMREALRGIVPEAERYLIKVTWHGYATGTYTDPAALDLLLSALPGRAILLEGHTSSRNTAAPDWDWETESRQNRAWIRQQEAEYLDRTGLAEVMRRHRAQYVNVTEAWWDSECPDAMEFIPEALLKHAGAPLLSFAKVKGPTRLGISNLFGLIPAPLRSEWHGEDIAAFARVCCRIAKLYAKHFPIYGVVEALYSAVRWDRQGLYRSRWGNYDVLTDRGVVVASVGLPGADIVASRLQGQDIHRSAFFDVVRQELGWPANAPDAVLPPEFLMRFV